MTKKRLIAELQKLSPKELEEVIDTVESSCPMTREELEELEWEQSFTKTERVDYGYGYGVYGPL